MTSVQMLSRVRDLLDENSASFWSDANIYVYLSEAQRQLTNIALKLYQAKRDIMPNTPIPDVLRPLITVVVNLAFGSTGTSTVALPSDYLSDIHVEYDDNASSPIPAFRVGENQNRYFNQNNSFLKSTQAQYTYWVDGANLNFGTAVSGTGAYRLTYLKQPTEINATPTNPILPSYTHEALCQYAVAEGYKRDKSFNESQLFYNQFLALIQNFI